MNATVSLRRERNALTRSRRRREQSCSGSLRRSRNDPPQGNSSRGARATRARTPPREGPFQTDPVARSRVLIDEEAPPPLPSARPPLHVFSILPFHTSARTPCHGRHQFHRER